MCLCGCLLVRVFYVLMYCLDGLFVCLCCMVLFECFLERLHVGLLVCVFTCCSVACLCGCSFVRYVWFVLNCVVFYCVFVCVFVYLVVCLVALFA